MRYRNLLYYYYHYCYLAIIFLLIVTVRVCACVRAGRRACVRVWERDLRLLYGGIFKVCPLLPNHFFSWSFDIAANGGGDSFPYFVFLLVMLF